MELSGCGTALVTPFLADGAVDEASLVRLVNWQIESGVNFLIPCGTTGEASTLNEAEWLRVVEVTVNTAAGRVPVFGGCTHNATGEAVARVKKLAQVPGLTVKSDKTALGANESATISITWAPAGSHGVPPPASCGVSVKPTSAFLPFTVTFR